MNQWIQSVLSIIPNIKFLPCPQLFCANDVRLTAMENADCVSYKSNSAARLESNNGKNLFFRSSSLASDKCNARTFYTYLDSRSCAACRDESWSKKLGFTGGREAVPKEILLDMSGATGCWSSILIVGKRLDTSLLGEQLFIFCSSSTLPPQ